MSTKPRQLGADPHRPITIAVLAMGGQGGGVLVDWIVDLAENNGFIAQSTSVPGVAQRTGATIYYIELFSQNQSHIKGQTPVLALMPVPGEVDIVITSELMEAGRAMLRGLVTPQRTTLITSNHRDYATVEKIVPGNGIADSAAIYQSAREHAQRFIHDDMLALARESGSVISAVLFGALAGCDEMPFDDAAFEATIRRAGVGVERSLRAFRAGAKAARQPINAAPSLDTMSTPPRALPKQAASLAVEPLRARIERDFPAITHAMLGAGLQRVLEFQDIDYGHEYLTHMADLHATALACGDASHGYAATLEAARWVAVAMTYDDVIRVADLKMRADRLARVHQEIGAPEGEIVGTTEYFHPRLEEIYGLMPARLAQWVSSSALLRGALKGLVGNGKRIQTHTLKGHLMLSALSSLRAWRRSSSRHAQEMAHMHGWLNQVKDLMQNDHALGLEMIQCRRLVKGYSDTHARGSSKFDQLQQAANALKGRADAAQSLASLRAAALSDVKGDTLQRLLQELKVSPVLCAVATRR